MPWQSKQPCTMVKKGQLFGASTPRAGPFFELRGTWVLFSGCLIFSGRPDDGTPPVRQQGPSPQKGLSERLQRHKRAGAYLAEREMRTEHGTRGGERLLPHWLGAQNGLTGSPRGAKSLHCRDSQQRRTEPEIVSVGHAQPQSAACRVSAYGPQAGPGPPIVGAGRAFPQGSSTAVRHSWRQPRLCRLETLTRARCRQVWS